MITHEVIKKHSKLVDHQMQCNKCFWAINTADHCLVGQELESLVKQALEKGK